MTTPASPPPAARTRVAVIGGGRSCEHEVSLASAAGVAAGLDPAAYEAVPLTIAPDGRWLDADGRPLGSTPAAGLAAAVTVLAGCDAVFPAVHGPLGEDGTLAALLDLADLPYVGSGVRGGALAMDKWATKLVAAELGIRTAPGLVLTAATASAAEAALSAPTGGPTDTVATDTVATAAADTPSAWSLPVVVKPVAAGSSHGVALVREPEQLAPALAAALALDERVLVEQAVVGREVDVAVLERADGGLLVGPALEIEVGASGLFDTDQKYGGGARFLLPAALAEAERKELDEAALALFAALGCRGLARFDFFLTADGPVLNEVNTMPGLTEHSQAPKIFAAVGLPYPALLDELVRGAQRRHSS